MTLTTCALPVRVYWEDTDAGGVVFYANYLKFFERARTEWLRTLGFEQQRLKDDARLIFIVISAEIRYLAPARLDDVLAVSASLADAGPASLTIDQQARRGETLLAAGRVRIGCVDALSWRPRRLPANLLAAMSPPPA